MYLVYNNQTPLSIASEKGHCDIVQTLLKPMQIQIFVAGSVYIVVRDYYMLLDFNHHLIYVYNIISWLLELSCWLDVQSFVSKG